MVLTPPSPVYFFLNRRILKYLVEKSWKCVMIDDISQEY